MVAHGIMFHHFYDSLHPRGQGAISADEFDHMLSYLAERHSILDAKDWMRRALRDELVSNDICITFDDSLRCQYDIAKPVLDRHDIRAFWFVYSSVFEGNIEPLELYRYFRTVCFKDFPEFYNAFFRKVRGSLFAERIETVLKGYDPDAYIAVYPFYSRQDAIFRFVRDRVLEPAEYGALMDEMIQAADLNIGEAVRQLWMTNDHIRSLHLDGHVIGLHSHSHPMLIEALPLEQKREEYSRNHRYLSKVLGEPPIAMSHPCNSYDADVLDILAQHGIRLGFRADMEMAGKAHSMFEWPRTDQAVVSSRMSDRS